jgi:hypothetical protein
MVQKDSALVTVRKHPEVFCLSLGMRISRVGKKPQDIVRVLAQTQQEISRRGLPDTATLLAPARIDDPLQAVLSRNTSPTTSDGLAFSNGRPASAPIPHSCSLSRSAHEFNNIIRQMSQKNKPLSALFCHRCIRWAMALSPPLRQASHGLDSAFMAIDQIPRCHFHAMRFCDQPLVPDALHRPHASRGYGAVTG